MRIFAPLTAIVSILGVATAFPSYSNRADHEKIASIIARATNSRDAGQYTAFLKKAAEIKAGKSDHADIVRRALNGTDANGDNGTDNNGFGRRKLNALINPANFKFNAQEQHIDLTSDTHKFIAPGPDDIRGPCPGLNLLANHGYLDRSGVTNLFQGIDAINKVFGVEYDLALALNAYAVVFNGNILDLTWSIGGPYGSKGIGAIGDILLGQPAGINAHNIYEGDASIVRQDYYDPKANRDNVKVHLPYFQDLLNLGNNDRTEGKDVYNAEVMLKHKANRWHESVNTNPYFFNSAFGGLVVTTAAERFVAEFAANNTADADGYNRIYLDEKNLLAFFGVERKADNSLSYTPGHERLIPGWTRRPLAATFGLDDIVLTLLNAASIDPSLLSVGGNAGRPKTFTGVNVGDLTGGVFSAARLLDDPQALACYLYQIGIEELVPTQLNVVYKVTSKALDFVGKYLTTPFRKLATAGNNPCNPFNSTIVASYDKYPGSKIESNGKEGLLGALVDGLTGGAL